MAKRTAAEVLALADCANCQLCAHHTEEGTFAPVPDEIGAGDVLIVGQAPSYHEVQARRPYAGDNSAPAITAMEKAGMPRGTYSITDVVACAYPGQGSSADILRFEARWKGSDLLDPKVACAPRLRALIEDHPYLILQGSMAAKAVMPGNPKLDDLVGGPWPPPEERPVGLLEGHKVLCTYHPARVSREARWGPVLDHWTAMALRWFRNELRWKDPPFRINPPLKWLWARLEEWKNGARPYPKDLGEYPTERAPLDLTARRDGFPGIVAERVVATDRIRTHVLYDWETDSVDPDHANVRCVCFFDGHLGTSEDPGSFILRWRSAKDHLFRDELDLLRAGADPTAIISALRTNHTLREASLEDLEEALLLYEKGKDDDAYKLVHAAGTGYPLPVTQMDKNYERGVRTWMRAWATAQEFSKGGWNSNLYDQAVFKAQFGVLPAPHVDWMVWHKLAWPDWKHGLKLSAAILLDVWAWAAEIDAIGVDNDDTLALYNMRDGGATGGVAEVLQKRAARNNHTPFHYALYDECGELARGIRRIGRNVDVERLEALIAEQEARRDEALELLDGINPNSPKQVARFLYEDLALPPPTEEVVEYGRRVRKVRVNPSGTYPTDDEAIREAYCERSLLVDDDVLPRLKALRDYRAAVKMLSTFLTKFRPGTWDKNRHAWICTPQGVVHPQYAPTGTAGWRWASFGMWNDQNLPNYMRHIFRAPPGYVYVYIDMDGLELRMAAGLAGAESYLDVFERNHIDVHCRSMEMILGPGVWNLPGAPTDKKKKGEGEFANRRDLIKRAVYLGIYWGEGPTFKRVLSEVEEVDAQGRLVFPYARYPVEKATAILAAWRRSAPEFERWWQEELRNYRLTGYVEEPVWGLRRFFPDGEERSQIINTKVQSAGKAIVLNGTLRLMRGPVPFNFRNRTGIIADTHDSIVVCCRAEDAENIAAEIEGHLVQRHPAIPVTFTAGAKIQRSWNNPPCSVCRGPTKFRLSSYDHKCTKCGHTEE